MENVGIKVDFEESGILEIRTRVTDDNFRIEIEKEGEIILNFSFENFKHFIRMVNQLNDYLKK